MFDFDPRDYDSRDDERHASIPSRGSRGSSDDGDRDDDWSRPHIASRDRNDDDARTLDRGPGNDRQASDEHGRDRRDDVRWAERDRDGRERQREARDTFTRHLHLPRGIEREIVRDRDRERRGLIPGVVASDQAVNGSPKIRSLRVNRSVAATGITVGDRGLSQGSACVTPS